MKKFFYRHRMQIFALVVGVTMILSTFTLTCGAVENEPSGGVRYPTPTAPFPDHPTFSNPVYINYKPLYNATYSINKTDYDNGVGRYTLDILLPQTSTSRSNVTPFGAVNPTRVDIRYSVYTDQAFTPSIPYFRNNVKFNDVDTIDSSGVYLYLSDFFYIPFIDYSPYYNEPYDANRLYNARSVLKVRMWGGLLDIDGWVVTGTFQFMGNIQEHEFQFEKVSNASLAGFNIDYVDIMRGSAIGNDANMVGIFIKDLKIHFPAGATINMTNSNCWIDVYIPCATEDEFNALYNNNLAVFTNTGYNYQQWEFNFSWVMNAVNSVLNAPLFGMISLGGIAFTVVGALVGVALLKALGSAK